MTRSIDFDFTAAGRGHARLKLEPGGHAHVDGMPPTPTANPSPQEAKKATPPRAKKPKPAGN